ncbi:hypothetical protein Bbelb_210280 [Branchiostoma belcheri]|nr:hypothetical protein Bbelb_210280 [Branchiostoma belcheri]
MVVSSNKDSPTVLRCLYLIKRAWNKPNSSNSGGKHRECYYRRPDNQDICLQHGLKKTAVLPPSNSVPGNSSRTRSKILAVPGNSCRTRENFKPSERSVLKIGRDLYDAIRQIGGQEY